MNSSPKKNNSPSNIPSATTKVRKPSIHTVTSEDEEDCVEEMSVESKIKQLSSLKYFQKRGSFDYNKLKEIEKPIRRASTMEVLNNFKVNGNKEIDDKGFVKFSTMTEEIKTDEKDIKFTSHSGKPRRSILKNTFIEEDLILIKIFDKKTFIELIEKIDKAAAGNKKLYNDLVPKYFMEFWKSKITNPKQSMQILLV